MDRSVIEAFVSGALYEFPFYPELGRLERGKVRDNYVRDGRRISIATDRVSAFDVVMREPIPLKGQVLTQIAQFWFEKTQEIVPNHVIDVPDPNVLVVSECQPFEVEFIIRGYLAGSAWKDYARGEREKSGVHFPDGLRMNQRFDVPVITNTTKAKRGHDVDISEKEILKRKLLTPDQLAETARIMRMLYERGAEVSGKRGLILVDTKYEFGVDDAGRIVLIDEVHTPDSSRYWHADAYQSLFERGEDQRQLSKEFLRDWLKSQGFSGNSSPPQLPLDVIVETAERYVELYETVTGKHIEIDHSPVRERIERNLRKAGLLRGGYVQIIAGSETDKAHYDALIACLNDLGVPCGVEVLSAHRHTRELLDFLQVMNKSAEPVVYITVAGMSNALGGIVASPANNCREFPVINCPPFKEVAAYAVDIHSSLRMPKNIPAVTVVGVENAARAARNILKLAGIACS